MSESLESRLAGLRERFVSAMNSGSRLKCLVIEHRYPIAKSDFEYPPGYCEFDTVASSRYGYAQDLQGNHDDRAICFYGEHLALVQYRVAAEPAGQCLDFLPALAQLSLIHHGTMNVGDLDERWTYCVFDLAWGQHKGFSLPDATQYTWSDNDVVVSVAEFEAKADKARSKKNDRTRKPSRRRWSAPEHPGRWYAVIEDVFAASIAAIDVLLTVCGSSEIDPSKTTSGIATEEMFHVERSNLTESMSSDEIMAEIARHEAQSRGEFDRFVKSINGLGPQAKALAYLRRSASKLNEEALVYLASRGVECKAFVDELEETWKRLAVECKSSNVFDNWWTDDAEFAHISSILRAVEWCKIGGFDELFESDAKETYRLYRQAGANNVPVVGDCVFNLSRSKLALSLHKNSLDALLAAIEDGEPPATVPWEFPVAAGPRKGKFESWWSHASGYAFAACVVGNRDLGLAGKAVQALLGAQGANGSWSRNSFYPEPDIASTAMAIHALAAVRPIGWERAAKRAVDWLWAAQTQAGAGSPNPVRACRPRICR